MADASVTAVMVTYHTKAPLAPVLAALRPQVARLIIIDNGSNAQTVATLQALASAHADWVTVIFNAENIGLAAAQNQGIRAALAAGLEWVLLLDDDSLPAPDMVPKMLTPLPQATVGILAPRMVEQNVETPTHYLVKKTGQWRLRRLQVAQGAALDDVATVIASGSMIRRAVFEKVGLMREGFFIDYIDHDFCLRAHTAGFAIRVMGAAVLYHRQGNKTRQRLFGRDVVTQNYSPLRRYYTFRNRMFFLRIHGRTSSGFIVHEVMACGWDMLRMLALEDSKWSKLISAIKGLWQGLTRPIPPIVL